MPQATIDQFQAARDMGYSDEEIGSFLQKKGYTVDPKITQVFFPGTNLPLFKRDSKVANVLRGSAQAAPLVGATIAGVTGSVGGAPGRVAGETVGLTAGMGIKNSLLGLMGEGQTPQQQLEELKTVPKAALASATIEGGLGVLGKVLQPAKTLLKARNAAASSSKATISGNDLVRAGQKAVEAAPDPIKQQVKKFADYGVRNHTGRNYPISKALELKGFSNQAFSQAGTMKAGAANFYNKFIGDEIRQQLKQVAPEVAKYDGILSKVIFPAQSAAKRLIFPTALAGAGYAALKAVGLGK